MLIGENTCSSDKWGLDNVVFGIEELSFLETELNDSVLARHTVDPW